VLAGGALVAASTVVVLTPIDAATAATGFGSDWPVYHHDLAGTGVDTANTDLSSVSPAWTSPALDGQIYGEPLVEAGRVVVATENNTVYALAANSGAVLWSRHIATPVPIGDIQRAAGCPGNIGPTVGITSTPVVDPGRSEVFVVDDEHAGTNGASHHLVGLSLATGGVLLDTPVDPPGSTPLAQLQRAGLTLDAGRVIIGFGGNAGDCGPYHGWLVAVPEGGGAALRFEVAAPSDDREGAIWMGGAAPVIDGAGHIWVATGNSAHTSSTQSYDFSDGVLDFKSDLQPQPPPFFAPFSWAGDNAGDQDLGSSAPVLVPGRLVFQAGKSGVGYVVSQSSPGGISAGLASVQICGTVVDGGSAIIGNVVYSPCGAGVVRTEVSAGTVSHGNPSPTGSAGPPIIAGGLVWTIDHNGGILYGLDPSSLVARRTFPLGLVTNHFPTPTVADGLLLAAATNTVHAFKGRAGLPPPPPGPNFILRPGAANDVGAGADGSVWVVGTNPVFGGFGIWRWTGAGWVQAGGGAVALAADAGGRPWVVNSARQIYRWNGAGWLRLPGAATDVGVGANGSAWVIGTNSVVGGFGIWRWTGGGWAPVSGGAVRIAVGPGGDPWVVNSAGQIFHWNGAGWLPLPGAATDVGVGANGSAWVIGTNSVVGGFGIFRWTGGGWVSVPGAAVRIAADRNGGPWVVNSSHHIYSY
jgi:hypothetical protein